MLLLRTGFPDTLLQIAKCSLLLVCSKLPLMVRFSHKHEKGACPPLRIVAAVDLAHQLSLQTSWLFHEKSRYTVTASLVADAKYRPADPNIRLQQCLQFRSAGPGQQIQTSKAFAPILT